MHSVVVGVAVAVAVAVAVTFLSPFAGICSIGIKRIFVMKKSIFNSSEIFEKDIFEYHIMSVQQHYIIYTRTYNSAQGNII